MCNQVKYPEDFAAEVKAAYPDWPTMHQALDLGSRLVGDFLEAYGRYYAPTPQALVDLIDEGKVDELRSELIAHSGEEGFCGRWCRVALSMLDEGKMEELRAEAVRHAVAATFYNKWRDIVAGQ